MNAVSMPPPGGLNYHTDSLEKKQPILSKFKTQKPLFSTFSTSYHAGKENYPTPIYPAPAQHGESNLQSNFSLDGLYGQKSPKKRALMDAASLQENPTKKNKTDNLPESDTVLIPAPEEFPILHDDGTKPSHSYAMLIGMSILRAPKRRLTLAQIYKWISETYSYYSCADAGWQNSIRHNLSLNKAFVKQERPKDDPGKGNYWAIEVGMEQQFINPKQVKKAAGLNTDLAPMMSTTLAPAPVHETRASFRTMTPAPQELPRSSSFMPSEPIAPTNNELSSDATIPASDAFAPEEYLEDEDHYLAPPSSHPIQSSPPAMMHSSPPVAHHTHRRDDTPPPVPRFPTSSRTRSHKRNFASMDDSGYFSSLNSSVIKGQHGDRGQLTSEADRPRKSIKRGRAEEEIARLRGSSYDSPTKAPTFRHSVSFAAPPSSSPIRQGRDNGQMLPPLTPAIKLRPPPQAPPSISPNTNLRLHRDRVRQLVGSPDRGLASLDVSIPWSPAFQMEDSSYLDVNDFDIFSDLNANIFFMPGNGSPEKRSTKRPRMDRAHSTSVLGDITNMNYNKSITSTPLLKFTPTLASGFDSPCKQFNQGSPLKFNSPALSMGAFDPLQEDFCGAEFLTDELTEFSGVDIMQGFQKIGAGQGGSKGQNPRPSLGRSFSTRF